jgi:hypothetical protein
VPVGSKSGARTVQEQAGIGQMFDEFPGHDGVELFARRGDALGIKHHHLVPRSFHPLETSFVDIASKYRVARVNKCRMEPMLPLALRVGLALVGAPHMEHTWAPGQAERRFDALVVRH